MLVADGYGFGTLPGYGTGAGDGSYPGLGHGEGYGFWEGGHDESGDGIFSFLETLPHPPSLV